MKNNDVNMKNNDLFQAACAAMTGMLSRYSGLQVDDISTIIEMSIKFSDELLTQLNNKTNEEERE
jgi:hypothetical protein